jgi:hypothetical protein
MTEEKTPYIVSLSQIGSYGQELRYQRNRDKNPSLAEHSVADLRPFSPPT